MLAATLQALNSANKALLAGDDLATLKVADRDLRNIKTRVASYKGELPVLEDSPFGTDVPYNLIGEAESQVFHTS